MSEHDDLEIDLKTGREFDDIIDGYFPLQVSLFQMMERQAFSAALLTLSQAPIMEIAGLPDEAPVPLTIKAARAGILNHLHLWVWRENKAIQIAGLGDWHWFDGNDNAVCFNPFIRLAEPVFIQGIGFCDTRDKNAHQIVEWDVSSDNACQISSILQSLKWSAAKLWGPKPDAGYIMKSDDFDCTIMGDEIIQGDEMSLSHGAYFLSPVPSFETHGMIR